MRVLEASQAFAVDLPLHAHRCVERVELVELV